MSLIHFWSIPLTGRKTQITKFQIDDTVCSITNACSAGRAAIYCNEAIFTGKGLVKNIGQDAIDVLRDGLLEDSELYTSLGDNSAYIAGTKLNNPRPRVVHVGIGNPDGTLIVTVDPLYQVGIIVNKVTIHTTGLAFTALERLRDYIQQTNGV